MPLYSTNNRLAGAQQNLTTTFKTIVVVKAATATLKRGKLMELAFGADGAPNATDCQIVYDVSRQTADATATAATPNPKDPADTASGSVAQVNATAEGTITAASSLFSKALNQRASQIWYAKDEANALIWPATNLAGLAARALSPTYAAPVLIDLTHLE